MQVCCPLPPVLLYYVECQSGTQRLRVCVALVSFVSGPEPLFGPGSEKRAARLLQQVVVVCLLLQELGGGGSSYSNLHGLSCCVSASHHLLCDQRHAGGWTARLSTAMHHQVCCWRICCHSHLYELYHSCNKVVLGSCEWSAVLCPGVMILCWIGGTAPAVGDPPSV
jgi:hypothetical protein